MDVRPVDTQSIISTRNRIRLSSAISILCVLVYISINKFFNGAHVSWLHSLHFIVQPVILAISVADGSSLSSVAAFVLFGMLIMDGMIITLNIITISRCYGEPSASCFERIYEKTIWACLALVFAITDIVSATQCNFLHKQLVQKDMHEEAEKERLKIDKEPPTWNSIPVFSKKIKTLATLMLLFDFIFFSITLAKTSETPLYWLAVGHAVLDPIIVFLEYDRDKLFYSLLRIGFSVTALFDTITILLQMQSGTETVGEMLAFLINITYFVVNFMQLYFVSRVIDTLGKYDKYKQSI